LSIQSDYVKENFSLDKFWGTFYELQYHDNTQPAIMSCQRSMKSLNADGNTYKDLFSLHVLGPVTAVCDLEFNISDQPGVFLGHWRGSFRPDLHDINNTVIEVGLDEDGNYEWVLEFQCADNTTHILFSAINFYHRNPLADESVLPVMEARARDLGVGFILDTKPGITKVNQKVCVDNDYYPAEDAAPYMCGQGGRLELDSGMVV
jgi:hypothetical protein